MLARVRDQLRAQQMTLEVTQAAKDHIIKLGYDVAYGARPLRRVIQNMVEDVLAEHLLLGRYEPGTTIVVDTRPGRRPRHPRRRAAKTPGRGLTRPPAGCASRPGPEPLRLPGLRRGLPALGGPVPRLRRLEQPRRDRRPRAAPRRAAGARRGAGSAPRADPARATSASPTSRGSPVGHRRARPRPRRRPRAGLARPGRRRAGHRQVDAAAPGRRRRRRRRAAGGASCTPPARSRPPRSACAPRGSGCSTGRRRTAIRVLAEPTVGRIVEVAAAPSARRCSSSTRSRRRPSTSSTGRPAASARSASRPLRLMELAKGDGIAGRPGRPRHEGRHARRAEDARAPRRRRR